MSQQQYAHSPETTSAEPAVLLQEVLNTLKVSLGTTDTKFSAALGQDKRISVVGMVKGSQSYLTRVGTFDVDLSLQGIILLVS